MRQGFGEEQLGDGVRVRGRALDMEKLHIWGRDGANNVTSLEGARREENMAHCAVDVGRTGKLGWVEDDRDAVGEADVLHEEEPNDEVHGVPENRHRLETAGSGGEERATYENVESPWWVRVACHSCCGESSARQELRRAAKGKESSGRQGSGGQRRAMFIHLSGPRLYGAKSRRSKSTLGGSTKDTRMAAATGSCGTKGAAVMRAVAFCVRGRWLWFSVGGLGVGAILREERHDRCHQRLTTSRSENWTRGTVRNHLPPPSLSPTVTLMLLPHMKCASRLAEAPAVASWR